MINNSFLIFRSYLNRVKMPKFSTSVLKIELIRIRQQIPIKSTTDRMEQIMPVLCLSNSATSRKFLILMGVISF